MEAPIGEPVPQPAGRPRDGGTSSTSGQGRAAALYRELTKLARLGVARAETIPVGRRGHRTMYTITPAGRQALRAWLDEPLTPISVEFEGLVRIFAAPLGTREQLLRTLDRIGNEASELAAFNDGIRHEYLAGTAPFQHEAHVRTLVVDLMADHFDLIRDWAQRSRAAVEQWPDLECDDARQYQAPRTDTPAARQGLTAPPCPPRSAPPARRPEISLAPAGASWEHGRYEGGRRAGEWGAGTARGRCCARTRG